MKVLRALPGVVIKIGSDDTGDFKEYFFLVEVIPNKLSKEWKAVLKWFLRAAPFRWRQRLSKKWGLDED